MARTGDQVAGSGISLDQAKIRWLYLLLTVSSGSIVLDHILPATIDHLTVISERSYQERVGSPVRYRTYPPSTINSNILRLSDGTVLQLSSLGDFIVEGDTLEVERTPLWKEPLQYRKQKARGNNWYEVDSNKVDYRPYPYIVCALAFLLLFPWRWDNLRWSLQAGLALMLVCWLVVMIGTGGMGRLMDLF
jgi:hypothetical protein